MRINLPILLLTLASSMPAYAFGPNFKSVGPDVWVPLGFNLGLGNNGEVATGVDASVVFSAGENPKFGPKMGFVGVWGNVSKVTGRYDDEYKVKDSTHQRTLVGVEVGGMPFGMTLYPLAVGFEYGQMSEHWGEGTPHVRRPMAGAFLNLIFGTIYYRKALGTYEAPSAFAEVGIMGKLPFPMSEAFK